MIEVQKILYPVAIAEPKAIVIRCFDRRFRKAHRGFITTELLLEPEDYWPVKLAGASASLARPNEMKTEFDFLRRQIDFVIRHSNIRYIVLIAHEDCARYKKLSWTNEEPEKTDLLSAVHLLQHKYRDIEISAYYAKFADENRTQICFETVVPSSLRAQDQSILQTA